MCQSISSFLFLGKEESHLGQALFYKRMHGLKQKIYRWRQYGVNTTYTYKWNKYNAVSTTTYTWNKYNRVSTTKYTWNKWNATIPTYRVKREVRTAKQNPIHPSLSQVYTSYTYNGDLFEGAGTYLGGGSDIGSNAVGCYAITYGTINNGQYDAYHKKSMTYITGRYLQTDSNGYATYDGSDYYYSATHPYNVTTNYDLSSNIPTKSSLVGTASSTSSTTYPNGGMYNGYYYDGRTSSTEYSQGSTSYGTVSSTSSTAYPSNGYSGSYWYVSNGSSTSWSKGSTSYGTVSSTNSSAYPDNGRSGSYWYVYSNSTISYSQGSYIGDKLSTDRNAYPDNAKSGRYWYVFDGEA